LPNAAAAACAGVVASDAVAVGVPACPSMDTDASDTTASTGARGAAIVRHRRVI
jgi:hypothetical protein